jgi:8-oxo-dGTP pyrophosphatase MutT (NUDIX family)
MLKNYFMEKLRDSTLLFLVKKDATGKITEICLAMKKRGFGAGRWNGVGGKVEGVETILEAARREAGEEILVEVGDAQKVAELDFYFSHNSLWNQKVHVYFCSNWMGEIAESEEMRPEWFSVSEIPFADMWPDDIFWLPKVLAGELVVAEFTFAEGDVITEQKINTVESF